MYKKILLTAFISIILANASLAETYQLGYGSKDPDDDLASLRGQLMPGDELIIKDGTYTDMAFKFYGLGTEEEPITLRAETPGGVVLNGKSYIQLDGIYLIARDLVWYNGGDYMRPTNSRVIEFRGSYYGFAHHCRVTNCAIIDMNYMFIDEKDEDEDGDITDLLWEEGKKWIQVYGTNNRIDHCYFADKKTQDVLLVTEIGSDYNWRGEDPTRDDETPQYDAIKHRIDHNYFGQISADGWFEPGKSPNGYEAIRTGTSTYSNFNAEIIVEDNLFEDCNGEIEVISNKSCNNIYRNNTILNCKGGIVMRHGDGCLVENNVILGNNLEDSTGIRLNGQDHTVVGNYISGVTGTGMRAAITMRDAGDITGADTGGGYEQSRFNTIAFNTIVDCVEPFNIDSSGSSNNSKPPVDNTIINNIIYSPNATYAVVSDNSTSEFNNAATWSGNYFYAQSLGKDSIEGVEFVDPVLIERTDGLYTLSREETLSPALGMSQGDYGSDLTDIDGDAVPETGADVGADQLGADILSAPMSAADVGPDFSLDTWLNK